MEQLFNKLLDGAATERGAPLADPAVGTAAQLEYGGDWYGAKVVGRRGGKARVRYDGWGESHDEWVDVPSKRLRPASSDETLGEALQVRRAATATATATTATTAIATSSSPPPFPRRRSAS